MKFIKRLIAVILMITLLGGAFVIPPAERGIVAQAESTQTLTVTGSNVNVRSGAGTSYSKITVVQKGATYTVLGSAKDSSGKVWYKISVSGKTGYIISTYAKVTETTTGDTVQTLTVTGSSVNVRSGAGTSYSKVTVVQKGAKYTVLGSAKDSSGKVWYKISVGGKTGYIISTYAKVTTTTATTTAATTTTTKPAGSVQQLTITGNTVYIRSGAGSSYSAIKIAKNGDVYTVVGSVSDSTGSTWYKINVGSVIGYIGSAYVSVKTVTTTAATTTTTTTAEVTTTTAATTTAATTTAAADTSTKILTVTGTNVNV
ncbi:MAG: SH3 domain-containing protein, partial [Clostridia bacterium]|nr:SH3 domain-containing protein [Clostridia bacterium]